MPLLLALILLLMAVSADARPLDLDDLWRVREVSEARVSPDGQWVVYTVASANREKDEMASDLWMTRWDGRETLQLTATPDSEHSAAWSPDGRYLAFLSDRSAGEADEDENGDQLWLLDMRGGEAKRLTGLDGGVSGFDWAPDSRRIVFVSEVDPDTADEDDDDKPEPIVIDRLYFKEDITGYLGDERDHLFLLDVADGEVVQLTDGDYEESQPSWSPNGKSIAFVTKRGPDMDRHDNYDVYVMEAKAGAKSRRLTTNPGADGDGDASWNSGPPDWSPDGRRVAYLHGGAPEDIWYGLTQVGVIAARGGDAALPTASLDRNTLSPRWSKDGDSISFLLEDDRSVQLARVDLGDGNVDRLTPPGKVVYEFHSNPDGRTALVMTSAHEPAEVWVLDDGKLRQLSRQNADWLEEVDLARAQAFGYDSEGGVEIHGLLLRPRARGGSLPAIIRIHGGPVAQYQNEFDFEWQYLAANGYLVAGVNPRGSSGRGYEFQRMLFADWGHADVPDILAAADYLVEEAGADPERLGIGGWSYGGILTNYVIASTDRFRAATSGSGMSNMLGGYGVDQYVRAWEAELGTPWGSTDTWLRLSYPFLEAERISTPTLFLCGADDFNVPLAASEQMYLALKSLGVPTKLVIYPEQYHSLTRISFRADRLRRYLGWYRDHLE